MSDNTAIFDSASMRLAPPNSRQRRARHRHGAINSTRRAIAQIGLLGLLSLWLGANIQAQTTADESAATPASTDPSDFTPADIAFLRQFSLSALPPLPPATSNRFADDPRAQRLGRQWFFERRFSDNGQFSCASCHQPERFFTDGRALSEAMGTSRRNSPSLLTAAYSPWQYWDGRKDSLWSQALAPFEHPDELGSSRTQVVKVVVKHYSQAYRALFGDLPKRP